MPRTASTRARILAVAGTAAALAGAGTTAAASASAATVPPAPVTARATSANLTAALSQSPKAHAHAKTTPVKLTAATKKAAPAKKGAAAKKAAPARKTAAHARTTVHAAARPYQMYDSVTPSAIPAGKPMATYADGAYAASPAAVHGKNVTWIDTNGSDPNGAKVLDVEPGDATPASAATWTAQRLHAHPRDIAVLYTMRSEWPATQAAISSLPHWQQHQVRYWIADPTGVPHLVPGSDATQWYWGTHYDISTVTPRF
jgi:hypothetical protein